MKDLVDNAHASERAFESGSFTVHAQTCITPLRLLYPHPPRKVGTQ